MPLFLRFAALPRFVTVLPLTLAVASVQADLASLPRHARPDAVAAEAALKAVAADAAPEVVLDAWNAFCRTHFGAEAEPSLYARFGRELTLVDSGEWRHVSENSATLAWESNLPAVSFVEYGETNQYGQQTEPTDRPYYLHLHALTGLEPDRTYHCRLVAVDERGNRLVSPDRILSPRKVDGAVYVPGDLAGPPYKLDKADTTYVLTQDLVVPGNAIAALRDGITLDLNGHTVTFAEGATNAKDCHGIIAAGTHDKGKLPYQTTKFRVLNGTVRQGRGELLAANKESLAFNGLKLTGQDIEMAGVRVVYHAPQSWGAQVNHGRGKVVVHHCLFLDLGAKIVNRHGSGVRPLGFVFPKESPNAFELHHNLVARTRQNGLATAHGMVHNEVYVDSWSINSFALQPESKPGVDAGEHFGNKVFATGFNPYGFGWAHENLRIHDNLIHMHGIDLKARWIHMETWGDINCLEGVRVTNYGKGGQVRNNLHYWNNAIILRGGEDVELRGTGFYSDDSIQGLVFSNNLVKVESLDERTLRAACISPQGHASKPFSHPVLYADNVLESNIACVRFGDSYGKGRNHRFVRNVFRRLGDHPGFHTLVFDGGGYNGDHRLLDCVFEPGTAPDDVLWRSTSSLSDYSVAWTLSLTTAPGAQVAVVDAAGGVAFDGVADPQGRLDVPLVVHTVRPIEWKPGVGPEQQCKATPEGHQKQAFAPHRVTVRAGGKTAEREVMLEGPLALTLLPE